MVRHRIAAICTGLIVATGASAGCEIPVPTPQAELAIPAPPATPDPTLRPSVPDCLRGLDQPQAENCPRDELAAYGAEVSAWIATLNTYVRATNDYANMAARRANAAIAHAHAARDHADEALAFAECEAGAIRGSGS